MTPSIFLRIIDGKLVLWNYTNHEQYEIDIHHLERMMQLSNGAEAECSPIDEAIAESGCLDQADPENWGWDCLSRIFHIGTQIGLRPGESMPTDDGYSGYIEYCASIAHKIPRLTVERDGDVVPLPPPELANLERLTLRQALERRQTCRAFDREARSLEEVATALWATFGTVHGDIRKDLEAQGLMPVGYRRTSPSGARSIRARRIWWRCGSPVWHRASITIAPTSTSCPSSGVALIPSRSGRCCAPKPSRTISPMACS